MRRRLLHLQDDTVSTRSEEVDTNGRRRSCRQSTQLDQSNAKSAGHDGDRDKESGEFLRRGTVGIVSTTHRSVSRVLRLAEGSPSPV